MNLTYKNPVYPGYFADPFVWQSGGTYYAIGTGVLEARSDAAHGGELLTVDGRPGVFALLRSTNLVDWSPVGAALVALDPGYGDAYWAPEVAEADGRWWLYYSVGFGDKGHHLRVASADVPEGPYRDCGVRLTNPFSCSFAIDPSPFQDDDGQWYLFYARDFLDTEGGCRAGTGVVMDRLTSMTELRGESRTVARARHGWQRFMNHRVIYGSQYDWHTIEGPCVRKRNGRYWCLYSAGCWNSDTYGVDFAVADAIDGPWAESDNAEGARVLRTLPGKVIGPGHNSLVQVSGNDFIVYHAWDPAMTARRMFIDKLEWTSDGPRCAGPTFDPQFLQLE